MFISVGIYAVSLWCCCLSERINRLRFGSIWLPLITFACFTVVWNSITCSIQRDVRPRGEPVVGCLCPPPPPQKYVKNENTTLFLLPTEFPEIAKCNVSSSVYELPCLWSLLMLLFSKKGLCNLHVQVMDAWLMFIMNR